VLRAKLRSKNVATPFVREVRTNPVEKGALFEISYAKIRRRTIESVSYVLLEELIYLF
jgi:hypothetical protein